MSLEATTNRSDDEARLCRQAGDAAAYLLGELSDAERQGFEAHVAVCAGCAGELEGARRAIGALKTLAPVAVTRDFAPEVLARLESTLSWERRALAVRRVLAAAALFLLLLGGALCFRAFFRQGPGGGAVAGAMAADSPMSAANSEALAWLGRTQEPDGSWTAAQWGGDPQFDVALTSLAVLALLGPEPVSPDRAAAVRKAVGYLVRQQDAKGAFGPSFSNGPYNQGLASLALLRAFQALHDESLRPPIERAVAVLCARQTPEGGWGYWGGAAQEPNLSVTLWQTEALKLAVKLGWNEARPNVRRAVRWVASVADDRGSFGYRRANDFPAGSQTLAAMGAVAVLNDHDKSVPPDRRELIRAKVLESAVSSLGAPDYYRVYFLTAAMKALPDGAGASQLALVRGHLVGGQIALGAQRGSWPPTDRWGTVGGRVYATAMASLSLQ